MKHLNATIAVVAGVVLWAYLYFFVFAPHPNGAETGFSIIFSTAAAWVLEMTLTNRAANTKR